MKRLIRAAVSLYPARWRARYAREFAALLDQVEPSMSVLVDVIRGAIVMQVVRQAVVVPAVAAVLGAGAGVLASLLGPDTYAASAIVRVQTDELAAIGAGQARDIRLSIEGRLPSAPEQKRRTAVELVETRTDHSVLRLSYVASDALEALLVAQELTAALTNSARARAIEILEAPRLPPVPIAPDYARVAGAGAIVGFTLGGIGLLLRRRRRAM